MSSESPVTLQMLNYRGIVSYVLKWKEGDAEREASFETEEEAVTEMAAIEERLRMQILAGQGLTVNPFGELKPFINSKDVHFAALKLRPRGLVFREAVEEYVAAVTALKGTGVGVAEAARGYGEAALALAPYEVSLSQVVFEWTELKKQVGERPLSDLLKAYLKRTEEKPVEGTEPAGGGGQPPEGRIE